MPKFCNNILRIRHPCSHAFGISEKIRFDRFVTPRRLIRLKPRVREITHSVATRHRVGDGFYARPKLRHS